jgi:hypothetical protein
VGTGGLDAIGRPLDDVDHVAPHEVALGLTHLDTDGLAGKCSGNEQHPAVVEASESVATSDESLGHHHDGRRFRHGARVGTIDRRWWKTDHMSDGEWYWDLQNNRAVPADQRGPADQMMGPYSSKFEAEHWQDKVTERNDEWDEADEEWRGDDDEPGGGDSDDR